MGGERSRRRGRAATLGSALLLLVGLLAAAGCGSGGGSAEAGSGYPAVGGEPAGEAQPGSGEPGPARHRWALLHWNVKSGIGQPGWTGGCAFTPGMDDSTNAWGSGAMQATLQGLVANEPEIAVATLNEAWASATPQRVRALLGWEDVYTGSASGLGIVAKHGFAGACHTVELPRCSEDAETRWVLACPVYVDGALDRSVVVYATHWTRCEAEGRATADILRRGVGAVPGSGGQVLAGDLNEKSPDSPTLAPLLDAGFVDAWMSLRGDAGATATWNRQYGHPRGNLYKRIDYVFSRGVTPVDATRFNDDGAPGTCKESDHAGLIVHYTMP